MLLFCFILCWIFSGVVAAWIFTCKFLEESVHLTLGDGMFLFMVFCLGPGTLLLLGGIWLVENYNKYIIFEKKDD